MTGVRVDVLSAQGQRLGTLPAFSVNYSQAVDRIGSFSCDFAAEKERAELITQGGELQIYVEGEGLVFRGIVDELETVVDDRDTKILRASGSSISRRLVWANTLLGRTFASVTLASAVDTLLGLVSGFSAGEVDTPPALTVEAQRMDGLTVWTALTRVAEVFGVLLRERSIDATVDVGKFGTTTGIRFQNVQEMTPALAAQDNVYALTALQELTTTTDVWNNVIPLGTSQGIAESGASWNLANSDRTSPYTISSATGPDGLTYYSIGDSDSQTAYGTRTKVIQIKDAAPLGLTSAELTAGANTLYDRAVTWLQRRKDPQTSYAARVVGPRHIVHGEEHIRAGDKIRLKYSGVMADGSGTKRLWKDVDAELYVMEFRRSVAGVVDTWDFVLSNVTRQLSDDNQKIAELADDLFTLQASPNPFFIFGNNVFRADENGMQMTQALDGSRGIWLSAATGFADTPSEAEDIGLLRGAFTGFGGGTGLEFKMNTGAGWTRYGSFLFGHTHDTSLNGQLLHEPTAQMMLTAPSTDDWGFHATGKQYGDGGAELGSVRRAGVAGMFNYDLSDDLTISSGEIEINGSNHRVGTEGAASSDVLDTISLEKSLQDLTSVPTHHTWLLLTPINPARVVTVEHGSGNITLSGGDYVMDSWNSGIMLRYDAVQSVYIEVWRFGAVDIRRAKAADEVVNNSTTLQDDNDWTFPVAANSQYIVEGFIWFNTHSTPDIKFGWSLPAGAEYSHHWEDPGVGSSGAHNAAITYNQIGTTTGLKYDVGLSIGANAGVATWQWAQATAHASDTTVYEGSYIRVWKV